MTVRQPRVNDKRIDSDTGERRAVLLGDPAGVGAEVAAGDRGAAAAVPARAVQRGLRPGAGAVPRLRRAGLSATTITRLTAQWQDEAKAFSDRIAVRAPTTSTCGSTAST